MLTILTHFTLFGVIALSGTQAEDMKVVCPREEIKLICPHLEPSIKSGDYKELFWTVLDPRIQPAEKQYLVHYDENVKCNGYSLGIFDKRVKIISTEQGMLVVEQLMKDDLLTFACYTERQQNKSPLVYQVDVSSSVKCLSLDAGQDVNLNQVLGEIPSRETVEDTWWYWIKPNGEKQKIFYCNTTACLFEDCSGSCPQCRPRLKIDGVNLVLMNASEEDRGLKLECRMYPKIIGSTTVQPTPRVYKLKIKDVFVPDSVSDTSQSKTLKPLSTTPTRKSTARVHGTQSSAGSQVLAFTAVFTTLIIALFEIS